MKLYTLRRITNLTKRMDHSFGLTRNRFFLFFYFLPGELLRSPLHKVRESKQSQILHSLAIDVFFTIDSEEIQQFKSSHPALLGAEDGRYLQPVYCISSPAGSFTCLQQCLLKQIANSFTASKTFTGDAACMSHSVLVLLLLTPFGTAA